MLARFFVDRPVFATVLSIVIVLVGLVALTRLPVAQYPEVVPPTISISAVYPGANAKVVADTVAAPIEQEVNGVEGMLYMSTKCTNDGAMSINVTFELGTDIDFAQVLTQNRVSIAQPKVPEEVRRQGITVKKRSPDILMGINLVSTEKLETPAAVTRKQVDMSRFAQTQIRDELARIKGVGDVTFLGAREYSMRVWLDPERLATRQMTASDVVRALREQNVQVAAGQLGQPPGNTGLDRQLTINALGRLLEPVEFERIILKTGDQGEIVRLADVARVEIGAKNYELSTYLDGTPSVMMGIFLLPGSNALATADAVKQRMRELRSRFPKGTEYRIVYDTTVFVDESIHEVYKTLFEAFVLVFIVVLVFLQDWRATLLPMIDVPVSLIGTFAVMAMLGFSLNNLSLFGLVLAIGIVVDDAIVVVENIERWMATGLAPREATIKAMDEITGPVIAITLVLASVFVPTAFIAGISGEFYRQFALTIAVSTIISAINALTMAPARAVTLLKPHTAGAHGHHEVREALPRWGYGAVFAVAAYVFLLPMAASTFHIAVPGHDAVGAPAQVDPVKYWGLVAATCALGFVVGWLLAPVLNRVFTAFFRGFNAVFDVITRIYGAIVARLVRFSFIALILYAGLLGATYHFGTIVPSGFIPEQDKGYVIAAAMLPESTNLAITEEVMARIDKLCHETPGVAHTLRLPGYYMLQGVNLTSAGGLYIILDSFSERRHDPNLHASKIVAELQRKFMSIQDAQVLCFGAPAVNGLGTAGGFKLQVEDLGGAGYEALQVATQNLAAEANKIPGLVNVFSGFRANQPQLFVDVDRTKAKTLNIPLSDVFETLQSYLGSSYANDFTDFGRNWQVNVQADAEFRRTVADIMRLEVRSTTGEMVKLASVLTVQDVVGPSIAGRYNLYPTAEINGATAPSFSSGQAVAAINELAARVLPSSMAIEWTELTYLQILADRDLLTKIIFPLGVVFVFMVLAAQYESWSLPMAVILIVPMSVLSSLVGIYLTGGDNNIFTQVGLLVLVALAAKNAILIVEFAKERQTGGKSKREAVLEAATVRLRPIIMTSLAFILGVVPLALGTGAGAEMRNALGIAVFSGMLGVTFFGIFLTPVFYNVIRRENPPGTAPPLARQPHDVCEANPPQEQR
jgi:multidrug efflux pump